MKQSKILEKDKSPKYRMQIEYKLWVVGICFGVLLLLLVFLENYNPNIMGRFRYDCLFHKTTGLYCPGCGGTRAVYTLLRGNIFASVYYHPIVGYAGVLYVLYMIRGAMAVLSNGRCSFMKWRLSYVYIGIGIILLQFVIKNILLIVFHIAWI